MPRMAMFPRMFSRANSVASKRTRICGPLLAWASLLLFAGTAIADGFSIFGAFPDDSGKVQSATADPTLNANNKFFDASVGTNGQACVTCHQPAQGFTIHVSVIDSTFTASGGTDPLFRPNDTANNPHTTTATADAYSLFLNMGAVRVGKTLPSPTIADFNVAAADANTDAKFAAPDHFPLITDPQHPGVKTLSLFRRPLVNTNVHLDSSVLWDGRDSITTIATSQVPKAIQSLLTTSNGGNCAGCPGTDPAVNQDIANFMLGVFTDQVFDTAAGTDAAGNCTLMPPGRMCGAGNNSAGGAQAGVANLLSFALGPNVPCTNPLENPCDANVPGYDLFDAWANLSIDVGGRNAARMSVARGQEIFNHAVLNVPADLQGQLGTTTHCTGCHATHNIGNNPSATFFARVGTDSLDIINQLLSNTNLSGATLADLAVYQQEVSQLPQYCLRPKSSVSSASCSSVPGDVVTTDPGHAMVSGHIADVGKFKPPILRGLAARSPYFHAGTAQNIQMLIHFYNARFQIGLTEDEVNDLGAFLEAQ
jgi:cytochrome c peroxidase